MTKAERTKQFIIEQSAPIFNTKGIAGTAMSDIMEATKLAKGSLYLHFENKEELSYSAVDYNMNIFSARAAAATEQCTTAKEKLLAMIDLFSDPLHPLVQGGCPLLNFGMEADDTSPVISQKINHGIERMIKTIAGIVDKGIANGEFVKEWNAEEFAIKSFAALEGGVLMSRVSGNNDKTSVIVKSIKTEIHDKSL